MNKPIPPESFGIISEQNTLTIQRMLPGPVDRVWRYLTESDLRRKWLASGDIELKEGSAFTLTWHNDELTNPPGLRPEGFGAEHSLESRIVEIDPPLKLVFTWRAGEVSFELQPRGEKVLLTLTHRRISDRNNMVMIGAGWHMHLDILLARVAGAPDPAPFWDGWRQLRADYEQRIPG
jgi:uncharacterized protein YndB with AHSA1/START domain